MSKFIGRNQYDGRTKEQRFWEKVSFGFGEGACWTWIASINSKGYGNFSFRDAPFQAHRVSWIFAYGEIPEGMLICHHCDNPACVNPKHLFMGTNTDNMRDMSNKGNSTRGEKSHTSKLTEEDVKEIRQHANIWGMPNLLAKQFNVSRRTIYAIKNGETWNYLPK